MATRVVGLIHALSKAYFTKNATPSTRTTTPATSIQRPPISLSMEADVAASAGIAAGLTIGVGGIAGVGGVGTVRSAATAGSGAIGVSRTTVCDLGGVTWIGCGGLTGAADRIGAASRTCCET